jgi:dipeptidyl-peptidase 4
MTDSFPRQEARTRRFSLGVPRAFRISPDGRRVAFLRTGSGTDPVTCLWVLDVISGRERLVADPRTLGLDEENLPAAERARRERVRESAGGIVAYATDRDVTLAFFALSGQVHTVSLTTGPLTTGPLTTGPLTTGPLTTGPLTGDGGLARAVATLTPALDPRPDPTGRRLAYVCAGALRVTSLDGGGEDVAVADPQGADGVTFGLPEFIAAEEMDRQRGYWWSPDGSALLVARADETPVTRWYIADPAHPERTPAEVAYPAAGTPNAEVSLLLARLDGSHRPVETGRAEFPYLVTVSWEDESEPLIVVQSRDQRRMRLLALDPGTGQTRVLLEDSDPHWLEIVPGVPARLPGGRIVWARDEADTRRLVVLAPDQEPVAVTPPGLQVRGVLDVDGEVVLFSASAEPTEVELWTYGPAGQDQVAQHQSTLARAGQGGGVEGGTRAGGTTVSWRRDLEADGVTVTVHRDGLPAAGIASHAERPLLPEPRPVLLSAGPREIRTAVLFPSWHREGQAKLPVLLDPYGGPHAQRVLKARGAYLTSQWFAEQGFAVVVADGRGTPARGPQWERAVAGDLAGPPLADQIDALQAAAERFGDLDTGRVAIRGWSFGGYLSALAVLRRPDVFHAAVAGAPVTDWHLYDTHYTERYLGLPDGDGDDYDRSSLLFLAERSGVTARPVLLIHGLADDNVVVAHTLRLSGALLAAGYPHSVLPLTGITHMASQETVAENLLTLQLDFLRGALAIAEPGM